MPDNLKIEYWPVSKLKPYPNNPRDNTGSVGYVAQSIHDFGFKQPIVIDRDGTIIAGHTRLAAAKKLRLKSVPVVIADDLDPDQVKAYRIADNSSGEHSRWEPKKLSYEALTSRIDLQQYGLKYDPAALQLTPKPDDSSSPETAEPAFFGALVDPPAGLGEEVAEEDSQQLYKDCREWQNLNVAAYEGTGRYRIPELWPEEPIDETTIWEGFNYALSEKDPGSKGIHFFLDDYQFERVWASPMRYLPLLRQFKYVIAPDFSQYGDWPPAVNLYNAYRKMWCAKYWQENGVHVIPYVIYREDLADWAFDGIPVASPICMCSVSDANSSAKLDRLRGEVQIVLDRLHPSQLIWYGAKPSWLSELYSGPLVHIPPFSAQLNARIKGGQQHA